MVVENKDEKVYRIVNLPIGYKGIACPKCGSHNLCGALLTEIADEQDPNVICHTCGNVIL